MLLAIDIGNTNIVLGVFDRELLTESWRLVTMRERTSDEIGILVTQLFERSDIDLASIDGIILSSVVPPLTRTVEEMCERFFDKSPLTVDPAGNTGMPVLYQPPSDVGADRVVNAVAAYETFGRADGLPVIVVDFGTATTFDAISARGEYIGGVICPGIGISADALFQRAARLPRVDVRKPPEVDWSHDSDVHAVGALLRLRCDGRWHRRSDARGARGWRSRCVYRDGRHGRHPRE